MIQTTPPDAGAIVALILAIVLLLVSGTVSASEVAFFSLSPHDLNEIQEGKHPSDHQINKLLNRSEHLLATILIVNNLVNISIVVLCNYFIGKVFNFSQVPIFGFLIETISLTFLLLLFGEIAPKVYASHKALSFARRTSSFLILLSRFFSSFSTLLVRTTKIVNKKVHPKNTNISLDDLSQALQMTEVEANEDKKLLEGIIEFGNKTVSEIMTSRLDVAEVEYNTPFRVLMDYVIECGYSRIPVYKGSQDEVQGIIYTKDLLPYLKERDDFNWHRLIRRGYFVPENMMIDNLLEEFRTGKIHLAIVVDEYGGISGIVTLEDVLEEIVGEISDEYDEKTLGYSRLGENSYLFEGKIQLNDFCKVVKADSEEFDQWSDEADTLAGLLLEIKSDFPTLKEEIHCGRFLFTVVEMNKRRIISIKVDVSTDPKRGKNG